MGTRATIEMIALGCPSCGASLDPAASDVLFLCPACGGVSELDGRSPVPCEARFLAPPAGTQPLVVLPFWGFGEQARPEAAPTCVTPAFNGARLLTLTAWYTKRAALLEAIPAVRAPGLWGGSIGSADARRIARLAQGTDRDTDRKSSAALTREASLSSASASIYGLMALGSVRVVLGDRAVRSAPAQEELRMQGAQYSTDQDRRNKDPRTPGRAADLTERAENAAPREPDDPRGGTSSAQFGKGILLGLPFRAEPHRLVCALTGLHIYLETLESGGEILARWLNRSNRA